MVDKRKSPTRTHILETADTIINGDRLDSYGPPSESFGRIAALWNAMGLRAKAHSKGSDYHRELNATDVALALIQLKMARLVNSPDHEDSWIDVAGYAGLGGEIALDGAFQPFQGGEDRTPLTQHAQGDVFVGRYIVFSKNSPVAAGQVRCGECENVFQWQHIEEHLRRKHPDVFDFYAPEPPPWGLGEVED